MVEEFILDPMADLELDITVPGWIRPYLQNYFVDTKETGESINDFLVRIMGKTSLEYRFNKLLNEGKNEVEEELTEDYLSEVDKL